MVRRVSEDQPAEVRINFVWSFLSDLCGPLPVGRWLWTLTASADDSPAAQGRCVITVTDDPDPRRRASAELLDVGGVDPT